MTLNANYTGEGQANLQWQVRSAPQGNGGQSWRIDPSTPTNRADLTPLMVGRYEVEVQAVTEDGTMLSCIMEVNSRSAGLLANLTWDGTGDLDLHLQRANDRPWFGRDCHFDNMQPQWVNGQEAGTGSNPALDRDDTTGFGPENIVIDTPELGVPYTVAVSHFERAAGRTARVRISCGRSMPVVDLTSRRFGGGQTGRCSRNDFWRVATVTFTASDQCIVDLHDDYTTGRAACEQP